MPLVGRLAYEADPADVARDLADGTAMFTLVDCRPTGNYLKAHLRRAPAGPARRGETGRLGADRMTRIRGGGALMAIEIPDATAEPAAYVRALLDTLGDRDPREVYAATAGEVRQFCEGLSATQWGIPLRAGEWNAAQIVGHLIDVDIVYGFRFRLVLTEKDPAYPGYQEKLWSQLPHPEPAELVSVLGGLRAYNTALLRHTPHNRWRRWGTHGEQGREQFGLMVAKIAGHDLAHLNQLARTIVVAKGLYDRRLRVLRVGRPRAGLHIPREERGTTAGAASRRGTPAQQPAGQAEITSPS